LLFRHRRLRNSQNRIALGVDVRGEGGYFIWWPREGHAIRHESVVAEWPEWLLELIASASNELPSSVACQASLPIHALPIHGGTRNMRQRVKAVIGVLEYAPKGRRNAVLFWAACRLAEVVGEGKLKMSVAVGLLEAGCRLNGLWRDPEDGPDACNATIASGFRTVEQAILDHDMGMGALEHATNSGRIINRDDGVASINRSHSNQ
jgi:hypothetical protein